MYIVLMYAQRMAIQWNYAQGMPGFVLVLILQVLHTHWAIDKVLDSTAQLHVYMVGSSTVYGT